MTLREVGSVPDGETPLAEVLRGLRQRARLTQAELAHRSGVSVSTIAGLENGRHRRARLGSLRLLAQGLGLAEAQFAELVGGPESPPVEDGTGPVTDEVSTHLPPVLAAFVGRTDSLDRLAMLVATPPVPTGPVIVTISGMAGVGKTTLALHWAHRTAHRYPGGQFYLNLRGFDPTDQPMQPGDAVRHLLAALTGDTEQPPAGYSAQVARYHAVAAQRRVLIVLDNARDAEQVAPLLPGSAGSLVIVTSRNQLSGLVATAGAYPLELDVLSAAEARELLAARVGPARVAAEPTATADIIAHCARLPLALSVLAARAATYPMFRLADLAEQLRATRRLDVLSGGDAGTDVRAVFSWSYQTLSPPAARLFRLLGTHGGNELSVCGAASLAGLPVTLAQPALAELAHTHLLSELSPGRYRSHDLLRAFAAELAPGDEPAHELATDRLLDYYLHTAHHAGRLIESCQHPIEPADPLPGVTPESLTDSTHAIAWFTVEHPALVAAVRRAAESGRHTHTWQLAWSMKTFFDWRGHTDDWVETQRLAVAATVALADPDAQGRAHRALATALARAGCTEEAFAHIQRALEWFTTLDDRPSQARTSNDIAVFLEGQGKHTDALRHARQALELHRALGDAVGTGAALNAVGWIEAQLGDYEAGLASCEQALGLLQAGDEHWLQASTLDSIGFIHHQLGNVDRAVHYYRRAADAAGPTGNRRLLAGVLACLGRSLLATGDRAGARAAWRQAAGVYDALQDPRADELRAQIRSG